MINNIEFCHCIRTDICGRINERHSGKVHLYPNYTHLHANELHKVSIVLFKFNVWQC